MIFAIGDIFEFIRNGMSVKQSSDIDGLPITRIETISNADIDLDRVGYAGLHLEDVKDYLLQDGDILFSHINSVSHIGKCALYSQTYGKLVHGMNLLCFRPNPKKILPQYAIYALKGNQFRSQLAKCIKKAVNQASVTIGDIKKIKIDLPPLEEQKRIAAIIFKAEKIKRERGLTVEGLDNLAQSIFIMMFGNPTANNKSLKQIKLGEGITLFGGAAFKSTDYVDDGIPLIRIGEVNRKEFDGVNTVFLPQELANQYSRFLVKKGSLLMSLTGTTGKDDYGNVVLLNGKKEKYFLNQRVAHIEANPQVFVNEFLYHLLSNKEIKNQIISKSRGVRQANISNSDITSLLVIVPSLEEQLKFKNIIDKLKHLTDKTKAALALDIKLILSLQSNLLKCGV